MWVRNHDLVCGLLVDCNLGPHMADGETGKVVRRLQVVRT